MRRCFWLLAFWVCFAGCEGKREAPKPLAVSLPSASPEPAAPPGLFAEIFRRRPVPAGTETNIDRLETELAKSPKDPQRRKAVGLGYYAAGGYEAAIKTLAGLTDPEALLYLGYAQMGLSSYDEALVSLGKIRPGVGVSQKQYGESELERGNIYFQALKQDTKAEAHYEAALKAAQNPEALVALGLLKASQDKTAEAQKHLLAATKALPAGKLRAAAFAALGRLESDPEKARQWYAKTRKDDPENPWLKKLTP